MLAARFYGLLWLLLLAVAFNTYLTDSFSYGTTMILGFSASILVGAGLLTVYPALLTERVSSWRKISSETKQKNSSSRAGLQRVS